jgi:hypothetical protein
MARPASLYFDRPDRRRGHFSMIKHIARVSPVMACVLFALVGLAAVEPAVTFSADLVTTIANKPAELGRVAVSNGKVRIDAPDIRDGFFIVDGTNRAAWFVRPRQQVFMKAKQSTPLTQLLVPVDPADPCRQWQIMEQVAGVIGTPGGWQCELVGREVVEGRETLKYLAVPGPGERSYRWIDSQREFPIKLESPNGTTIALKNIVDAVQPQDLFVIPASYREFDPQQLLDLIKQSDVWVESPR